MSITFFVLFLFFLFKLRLTLHTQTAPRHRRPPLHRNFLTALDTKFSPGPIHPHRMLTLPFQPPYPHVFFVHFIGLITDIH